MPNHKIALLPGDGIGPEIAREAVKIFKLVEERNDDVDRAGATDQQEQVVDQDGQDQDVDDSPEIQVLEMQSCRQPIQHFRPRGLRR